MKIIDLLNKIANDEKIPDGIKWGCHDFKWFVYEYKSINELGEPTLLDYLSQCPQMLNDEIITFNKTEEKKIPKKLENEHEFYSYVEYAENKDEIDKVVYILKAINLAEEKIDNLNNSINSIIDYLKSKGDE